MQSRLFFGGGRGGIKASFSGHSSGRLLDPGTISRGEQPPRDAPVLFVWDLATAGLPGTGFSNYVIQRDSLYGI